MDLEIVLVRHGESHGNRDRIFVGHGPGGLTERGHRQAEAVAAALADRKIDAIYSSDLPRAMATAKPLCTARSLEPILDTRIRERDVGAYTGLSFQQVKDSDPEGWRALLARDPEHRPPAGESHRDCGVRVATFLDELFAGTEGGHVVVFSHGVAINHMLRHALGIAATTSRTFFQVDNCSIHHLMRHRDGSFRVIALNDVSHLARLKTSAME